MLISASRARELYAGGRAGRAARRFARFWAMVQGWGVLPRRWVVLEVPGRVSGRLTRIPLGMADVDGRWYLGLDARRVPLGAQRARGGAAGRAAARAPPGRAARRGAGGRARADPAPLRAGRAGRPSAHPGGPVGAGRAVRRGRRPLPGLRGPAGLSDWAALRLGAPGARRSKCSGRSAKCSEPGPGLRRPDPQRDPRPRRAARPPARGTASRSRRPARAGPRSGATR